MTVNQYQSRFSTGTPQQTQLINNVDVIQQVHPNEHNNGSTSTNMNLLIDDERHVTENTLHGQIREVEIDDTLQLSKPVDN